MQIGTMDLEEGHIRWAYFGVSSISFVQCSGVLVCLTYYKAPFIVNLNFNL